MNKPLLVAVIVMMLLAALTAVGAESRYKDTIVKTALAHEVDPTLALAIAEVESRFKPDAVGTRGEIGLYQLRPEFHGKDVKQPKKNIEKAMVYLARIKKNCYPRYGEAYFICFNYGPNRRLKVDPSATRYYQRVIKAYNRRIQAVAQ